MIANPDNVSSLMTPMTVASPPLSSLSSTSTSTSNERSISRGRRNTTTRDLMLINNNQRSQPRPPSTSFFAIFYERPVRHRYYRQINRSATNLVRRLSQSRLFLNSSRAQNAAYRNNFTRQNRSDGPTASATAAVVMVDNRRRHDPEPQPESELTVMLDERNQIDDTDDTLYQNECQTDGILHRTHGGGSSIHSLNISNDFNQNIVETRLRSVASENDLFRNDERSETPPPPYNIVVHTVHHRKV